LARTGHRSLEGIPIAACWIGDELRERERVCVYVFVCVRESVHLFQPPRVG